MQTRALGIGSSCGYPTAMQYLIRKARITPELVGDWNGPAWASADIATIESFHPASSDHHPRTQAKLLYDDAGLYAIFRVQDRFVVCANTANQSLTCRDSCVELFVQPTPAGYFNFEMNCGGALLLYYITDATRAPGGFKGMTRVTDQLIETMRIHHSMPRTAPAEIAGPIEWTVEYFIPWSLFSAYVDPLPPIAGSIWRGNFYKCADQSSHPHWASWSPIGDELNFHVPDKFAAFRFAD